MRIFGGERLKGLMEKMKLPDDVPIQAGILTRSIGQAQSRVEGHNFDARKHLLEYDDVLNKQRLSIYKRRQQMLTDKKHPQMLAMLDMLWMTHLENMEALQESVRLRAYGQHDPLVEYRREGHIMFQQLLADFDNWLKENEKKLLQQISNDQLSISKPNENLKLKIENSANFASRKIGRNDPCPCGAINPKTKKAYKWKQCGLINAPHHKTR